MALKGLSLYILLLVPFAMKCFIYIFFNHMRIKVKCFLHELLMSERFIFITAENDPFPFINFVIIPEICTLWRWLLFDFC